MQSSYKGQIELTIILVKSPSDSGGATCMCYQVITLRVP